MAGWEDRIIIITEKHLSSAYLSAQVCRGSAQQPWLCLAAPSRELDLSDPMCVPSKCVWFPHEAQAALRKFTFCGWNSTREPAGRADGDKCCLGAVNQVANPIRELGQPLPISAGRPSGPHASPRSLSSQQHRRSARSRQVGGSNNRGQKSPSEAGEPFRLLLQNFFGMYTSAISQFQFLGLHEHAENQPCRGL